MRHRMCCPAFDMVVDWVHSRSPAGRGIVLPSVHSPVSMVRWVVIVLLESEEALTGGIDSFHVSSGSSDCTRHQLVRINTMTVLGSTVRISVRLGDPVGVSSRCDRSA